MVDITSITATVSSAVGVLKEVVNLAKKAGSHELNEKVADLQVRILDIQTQLIELTNENQGLKQRISELERVAEIRSKLITDVSVYWLPTNDGRDGPFCMNCFDAQNKLIRLTPGATKGTFSCGVCKGGGFHTSEYKPASSPSIDPHPRVWG